MTEEAEAPVAAPRTHEVNEDGPFAHLRPFAMQHAAAPEAGTVWAGVCPCCGALRHKGSAAAPADKLLIDLRDDPDNSKCPTCTYVIRRLPEVYDWVVNVVARQVDQRFAGMVAPMMGAGLLGPKE